jgi:hypothetical protein
VTDAIQRIGGIAVPQDIRQARLINTDLNAVFFAAGQRIDITANGSIRLSDVAKTC